MGGQHSHLASRDGLNAMSVDDDFEGKHSLSIALPRRPLLPWVTRTIVRVVCIRREAVGETPRRQLGIPPVADRYDGLWEQLRFAWGQTPPRKVLCLERRG